MRPNLIPFAAIITAAIFLISCEKEDPEPTTPSTPAFSKKFSLNLNGEDISVPATGFNTSTSGGDITIYAFAGKHIFNVYLQDTMTVGTTYNFEPGVYSPAVIYRDTSNMAYIYKSQSGSMTITYIDTNARKVAGIFNATLKENFVDSTHTITNGKFSTFY